MTAGQLLAVAIGSAFIGWALAIYWHGRYRAVQAQAERIEQYYADQLNRLERLHGHQRSSRVMRRGWEAMP